MNDPNWRLKTILFPTDGSETSLKAVPYALSLAEENQANVIFLRIMPLVPYQYQESEEARVREALRVLVPAEAEDRCKPEFVGRFDFPVEGILRFAEERNVDLVVMGVKHSGESAVQEHLPWPNRHILLGRRTSLLSCQLGLVGMPPAGNHPAVGGCGSCRFAHKCKSLGSCHGG